LMDIKQITQLQLIRILILLNHANILFHLGSFVNLSIHENNAFDI